MHSRPLRDSLDARRSLTMNRDDGRNIRLEIRNAERQEAALAGKAAELVRSKVDIIVVFETPAALAAKHATTEIPIATGKSAIRLRAASSRALPDLAAISPVSREALPKSLAKSSS